MLKEMITYGFKIYAAQLFLKKKKYISANDD